MPRPYGATILCQTISVIMGTLSSFCLESDLEILIIPNLPTLSELTLSALYLPACSPPEDPSKILSQPSAPPRLNSHGKKTKISQLHFYSCLTHSSGMDNNFSSLLSLTAPENSPKPLAHLQFPLSMSYALFATVMSVRSLGPERTTQLNPYFSVIQIDL